MMRDRILLKRYFDENLYPVKIMGEKKGLTSERLDIFETALLG